MILAAPCAFIYISWSVLYIARVLRSRAITCYERAGVVYMLYFIVYIYIISNIVQLYFAIIYFVKLLRTFACLFVVALCEQTLLS